MDVKQLCLGVLTLGDASGYDIKRYFEAHFQHFFKAGFGSIYPALSTLLDKGFVECKEQSQERLPDKKIYCVTSAGKAEFERALLATKPQHKLRSHFLVLMHFAHLLPPHRVADLIEEHILELENMLGFLTDKVADDSVDTTPGMRFAMRYGQELTGHARRFVADEGEQLLSDLVGTDSTGVITQ